MIDLVDVMVNVSFAQKAWLVKALTVKKKERCRFFYGRARWERYYVLMQPSDVVMINDKSERTEKDTVEEEPYEK